MPDAVSCNIRHDASARYQGEVKPHGESPRIEISYADSLPIRENPDGCSGFSLMVFGPDKVFMPPQIGTSWS